MQSKRAQVSLRPLADLPGLQPRIHRELLAQSLHAGFHRSFNFAIAVFAVGGQTIDDFDDPFADLAEFSLAKAAGGACGVPRRTPVTIGFPGRTGCHLLQVMVARPGLSR